MSQCTRIQAVTFDVGGTLIDPWPSVGHVYADVAAEHGMGKIDPELLNQRFAVAWRAKKNFDYSKAGWSELVSKTFHGDVRPCPAVPFFDVLYDHFVKPEVWRIYDDVIPAIERLLQLDLKLAVVSNWDERLRPLLKGLRLDGYFDGMAISSEIGFTKPSPVIFEGALRKLGVPANAVLHVGDGKKEDLEGARQAGMEAVLVSRSATASSPDVIGSLCELEALVL